MPDVDWTPDPLLRAFVKAAEEGLGAFEVTLAVGGVLIGGTIVSQSHWAQATAAMFREKSLPDAAGVFDSLNARIQIEEITQEEFIHLIDVRYVVGERVQPGGVFPWRGLLSGVYGWTFGTFTPSET
ncbi:MAG: hypothetical protein ACXVKA_16230 [Acidimicrobiia bacterium]